MSGTDSRGERREERAGHRASPSPADVPGRKELGRLREHEQEPGPPDGREDPGAAVLNGPEGMDTARGLGCGEQGDPSSGVLAGWRGSRGARPEQVTEPCSEAGDSHRRHQQATRLWSVPSCSQQEDTRADTGGRILDGRGRLGNRAAPRDTQSVPFWAPIPGRWSGKLPPVFHHDSKLACYSGPPCTWKHSPENPASRPRTGTFRLLTRRPYVGCLPSPNLGAGGSGLLLNVTVGVRFFFLFSRASSLCVACLQGSQLQNPCHSLRRALAELRLSRSLM